MASKTTNRFSPVVRTRAVRMGLDHEAEHPSRGAAVLSIAGKIGWRAQTLNEWTKKAEMDAGRKTLKWEPRLGRLLHARRPLGFAICKFHRLLAWLSTLSE